MSTDKTQIVPFDTNADISAAICLDIYIDPRLTWREPDELSKQLEGRLYCLKRAKQTAYQKTLLFIYYYYSIFLSLATREFFCGLVY